MKKETLLEQFKRRKEEKRQKIYRESLGQNMSELFDKLLIKELVKD